MRRGRRIQPEDLGPAQDKADATRQRDRFYVYILETDYGHYIGHSAEPRRRWAEHVNNRCRSTAFGNPKKAWISHPFKTRAEATGFEAAMKVLRNRGRQRFAEITGFPPKPMLVWKHRQHEIQRRKADASVGEKEKREQLNEAKFRPKFDLAHAGLLGAMAQYVVLLVKD